MIAVIADDFTGAAEIGGIALRQGYTSSINTSFTKSCDADVLIIATNTRVEHPDKARKTIQALTLQLLTLKPEMIYKKIDSVLRGNVGEELLEQMEVSEKKRALIIPSNPSLNRIIKNGIYYYNGAPLNSASFSMSAKAKNISSDVMDLMGEKSVKYTTIISKGDLLPAEGLIIGNTIDEADLDYWAAQFDGQTIMAGASSFFNALLKNRKLHSESNADKRLVIGNNKIYVCGSAFPSSRRVVADSFNAGQFVAHMPATLLCDGVNSAQLMFEWEDKIIKGMGKSGTVIIAVDAVESPQTDDLPARVSQAVATVVERVMQRVRVEELIIEGGATASSIIEKLNYKKLYPVQELAPGVIRMSVEENNHLFLTMKPGSYSWPKSIWKYK